MVYSTRNTNKKKDYNKDKIICPIDPDENMTGSLAECPAKILKDDACQFFCNLKTDRPYVCDSINSCNHPFERLSTGRWDYKDLSSYLKNLSEDQLKNQIKHNLSQLAGCRVKKPNQAGESQFGTLEWWRENVWGISLIQNFIYMVSFTVAIISVIYITYSMLRYGINLPQGGLVSGLVIVPLSLVLIVLAYVYSLSNIRGDSEEPNIPEQCRKEFDVLDNNDVRSKAEEVSYKIPTLLIFGAVLALGIGATVIGIITGKPNIMSVAMMILISLAITFNIYFAFLIPQVIIIGILVQKYFFSETFGVVKSIATVVITLILFFSTFININNNYLLSLIVPAIFIVYTVMAWMNLGQTKSWNILLMPIIIGIYKFATGNDLILEKDMLF